jgi:hypothetical protein
VDSDGGIHCQAPKLKLGWDLWLGSYGETTTSQRVADQEVLIGTDGGRTYWAD